MTPKTGSIRSRWKRSLLARFPGLGSLTTSSLLSETADQFGLIAIIWVVLVETGSPAQAGLAVMCRRAPEIISGPVLGAWFDRLPPIRLSAFGFLLRGSWLALIAVLTQVVTFNIWAVLIVCLLMGATNPLAKVGTRVIMPRLIPKGELQVANGVLTIGDQFPYLVGPALGGALAGFIGGWSLLVPTALCLVATVLIVRVRIPEQDAPKAAPTRGLGIRKGVIAGYKPLVTIPVVRAMMILTVIYFLSYGPLQTAIPVFAQDELHTGGAGYGAMWSAMGIGALAGLVTIPWLSRFRPAVVNCVGAALWGLVLLPMMVVTSLPLALVVMFVGGFVWAPYASTEISVIQDAVPAAQHGAAFGAQRSVIVASTPTGAALGGLMLLHLSSTQVVGLSALACIIGGIGCLALPSVRSHLSHAQRAAAAERDGGLEPNAPATAA